MEALAPLLGDLARLIARHGAVNDANLDLLLLGSDVRSPEAKAELARWGTVLVACRGQLSTQSREAAEAALRRRGLSEAQIILAIHEVSPATPEPTAPSKPATPRSSCVRWTVTPEFLNFGLLAPKEGALATLRISGPAGVAVGDPPQRVKVTPIRFPAGETTLTVHVSGGSAGSLIWGSVFLQHGSQAQEVPVSAEWVEAGAEAPSLAQSEPQVELQRQEGTLKLSTELPSVAVELDGEPVGLVTPVQPLIVRRLAGPVGVRARAEEHEPIEKVCEVRADRTTEVTLALPAWPILTIEVDESEVEVTLEGKLVGVLGPATPAIVRGLAPGIYHVIFRRGELVRQHDLTLGVGDQVKVVGSLDWPPANWPSHLEGYRRAPRMQYRIHGPDQMPQVFIPVGEFLLGSPDGEPGRGRNEGPQQEVFVSAFWIDLHVVTNEQYAAFLAATGQRASDDWQRWSRKTSPSHPAVYVSWDDASAYAAWVGRELPTEAQWEKAARGGTTTAFYWGDEPEPVLASGAWDSPVAISEANALAHCRPVGRYPPNPYGLLDMSGNVWEWCRDWYDAEWYARLDNQDPVNTVAGNVRTCRGGAWNATSRSLRVANRGKAPPGQRESRIGFRCVVTL